MSVAMTDRCFRPDSRLPERVARWGSPALLPVVSFLFLLCAGCGRSEHPKSVIRLRDGEDLRLVEVAEPGSWALYVEGDIEPRLEAEVQSGERIGFRRDPEAEGVTAVAGDRTWTLTGDAEYYWTRK